ncbi:hypothetical protein JCM10213_002169 [Rhodosporidiobolus nylandii]
MDGIKYDGPINDNPANGESSIVIYGYVPSESLATMALLCFGLVFLNHLSWLARHKPTRVFYGLFLVGNACEIVGYSCRLQSHFSPFVVNYFIVQYFFIVIAPVFYQAALYIALAQALRRLDHFGSTLLRFEPKILMWVMVVADVVTTIIQVVGAALIGVAESARFANGSSSLSSKQANDILLAGLSVQTASFLAFIVLLVLCIIRSERTFTAAHLPKRFSLLIFSSALLLLLRTTFRLGETAQGVFGFASSHESLFGTLEFAPVILAIAIWAAMPLEEALPIDADAEPRQDGTESTRTLSMRQTTSMKLGRQSSQESGSGGSSRERSSGRDLERDLEAGPSSSRSMSKEEEDLGSSSTSATDARGPSPEQRRVPHRANSVLRTGMEESDPAVLERTASGSSRMSARKLRN